MEAEGPSLLEQMMQAQREAKGQAAAEQESVPKGKQGFGSGLKKGFLAGASEGAKPQPPKKVRARMPDSQLAVTHMLTCATAFGGREGFFLNRRVSRPLVDSGRRSQQYQPTSRLLARRRRHAAEWCFPRCNRQSTRPPRPS